MKWIVNSMVGRIVNSFKYLDTAKELWDSIETAYAQKRNNARVPELKKEIVEFKQGSLSVDDYYYKLRASWKKLELYMSPEHCCAKKQCCAKKENFWKINTYLNYPGVLTKNFSLFVHRKQARILISAYRGFIIHVPRYECLVFDVWTNFNLT